MDTVIDEIFEKHIPLGYLNPQNIDNIYKTDLEKVVRALEIPPSVAASRFLIYGNGNQGQTHYFLPIIANRLDHLVMHSIS
uniref:Uncharacterized protein n=1 Tax=Panagrolaimus sp. ES5 TaxID=591445 RepID=A0AC34GC55_9BILA